MPRLELDVHVEAVAEATAARRWYAQRSERAETDFIVELDEVPKRLEQQPCKLLVFIPIRTCEFQLSRRFGDAGFHAFMGFHVAILPGTNGVLA